MRALLALLGFKAKPRQVREAFTTGPILHYVYERKRQPDGWGANRYAFETLGLASSSPIQGAVRVRRQISFPFAPQVWVGQAVKIAPIPSQSGGIYTGGMLTADGSLPQLGTETAVDMNAVAMNDPTAMANDPSSLWGPNDPSGGFN